MTKGLFFSALLVVILYSVWFFGFDPWYQALGEESGGAVYEASPQEFGGNDLVNSLVLLEEVRGLGVEASGAEDREGFLEINSCRRVGVFFSKSKAQEIASQFEVGSAEVAIVSEVTGVTRTFWIAVPKEIKVEHLNALERVLVRNGLVFVESDASVLRGQLVVGPFLNKKIAKTYQNQMQLVYENSKIEQVDLEQEAFWLEVTGFLAKDFDPVLEKMLGVEKNIVQKDCL